MESPREHLSRSTDLSGTQSQRLFIGLRHIDGLLAEVEDILQTSESTAVFPRHQNDLAYAEARTIEAYARQLRRKLMDVVRWQGLTLPAPDIPARRAVSVRIAFIEIAIEEMKPKYFRGSGPLSPAAEESLYGISGELHEIASRMSAYIMEGAEDTLAKRIDVLGTGEVAQRLKSLEDIVSRRGLVQFRPDIHRILEDLQTASYQIAVFGRVSSGKSSLLNALLGTMRLPVGTTPVTAIPTKIEYADEAMLEVRFLDGRSEVVPIEALPTFASEEKNRSNNKGVARLTLRLPLTALKAGVTFVDTPGVGSLARTGTKEAQAYLPSADLALVLVDAAGTLIEEDLDLLRLLDDSGVRSIVVLSKSDLLTNEDIQKVRAYTADQLKQNIRGSIPVVALSSFPAWEQQRQQFYAEYLAPLADKAYENRAASLLAKTLLLAKRILVVLENGSRSTAEECKMPNADQEERQRVIQAGIQKLESHCAQQLDLLRTGAGHFLKDVGDRIGSELVEQHRRVIPAFEVQNMVASSVQSGVELLIGEVSRIAAQIDDLAKLADGAAASPNAGRFVHEVPIFEAPEVTGAFAASRLIPGWLLRRRLAAFTKAYEQRLRADLQVYEQRLGRWVQICLSQLREALPTLDNQSRQSADAPQSGSTNDEVAEDRSTLKALLNHAG